MRTLFSRAIVEIGLIVLAVIPNLGSRASAAELPTIEMGLPRDGLFGLGGQYIIDKRLDRKNSFVMKPRWSGVAEIERLLAIGAIEAGLAVSESGLRANVKGIPIRFIQPFMEPHQQVLVRKGSPYRSVEDLKGKPVATTPEVTAQYNMFDFIMRKRGINVERDFQLKKLSPAAIIASIERGHVEAAILWEAHVSRLLATGKYEVIMMFRDVMEELLNSKVKIMAWVGGLDPWVKKHPDLIQKLRAAWTEAYTGMQKDEGYFRKYAKEFFGLEKPEEVQIGWRRTTMFLLPSGFRWPDPNTLKAEKSYLREGVQLGMFPEEALPLIDMLFVP